ncbi:hypothetical protein TNIN_181141 [Trichonephila inaurata madagascariensis]|uniref:Uncharacterized protein n=1 Tax=Trichonephila inaurata madagascariensis TaxID=2747483 RepID=A0A8X6XVA5_9ARAC|nr:hypothetical protein TNIN_181141 [Trichonephila inaurata madagascariensis]
MEILTSKTNFVLATAKNQRATICWLACSSLLISGTQAILTALTRFLSGHFRSLTYTGGAKSYAICTKCTIGLATPKHILEQLSPTRSPRTTGVL